MAVAEPNAARNAAGPSSQSGRPQRFPLRAAAKGDRFVARGKVIKGGRTLTVCEGEVSAFEGGKETPIAFMTATTVNFCPEILRPIQALLN